MGSGGLSLAMVVGAALGAVAAPRPLAAQSDQMRKVAAQVNAIGTELVELEADYRKEEGRSPKRPLQDRIANAESLVWLGEFEPASLVLLGLLGDAQKASQKDHLHVLRQLAESMFQVGNNRLARQYFREMAKQGKEPIATAVRRLLQIADRLEDYEGIDEYAEALSQSGGMTPDISYLWAKSYHARERYQDTIRLADALPSEHPYSAKAMYLAAVARLQMGDIRNAEAGFNRLRKLEQPFRYESGAYIQDLATLNSARLQLERGQVDAARRTYQEVRRTGDARADALYELAWVHVQTAAKIEDPRARDAELVKAMSTLQVYLRGEPEAASSAEARILQANIQLQRGLNDEALATFRAVVQRYEPVYKGLQDVVSKIDDPEKLLDELVAPPAEYSGPVPQVAAEWAARRKSVLRALRLVTDLAEAELWMYEASKMLLELMETTTSRVRVPPNLEGGYASLLELDSRVNASTELLLRVQREVLVAKMGGTAPPELQQILADRARMRDAYDALPKSRKDYEKRLARMKDSLFALEKKAFQLKLPLEEMRRELRKLKAWLTAHSTDMEPGNVSDLQRRMTDLENTMDEHRGLLAAVEAEIQRERRSLSIVRADSERDLRLRKQYARTLEQESQVLASLAQEYPGDPMLAEAARQSAALVAHGERTKELRSRYTGLARRSSQDSLDELRELQAELGAFNRKIEELRTSATEVVAEATMSSMREVEGMFKSIVVQGDVGIVDVAWQAKETKTEEINQRVKEQREQLEALDEAYHDVVPKD